ncbi:MAG: molecular chaperone DnaJ [Candidatus Moraniibacteriota bacterium]
MADYYAILGVSKDASQDQVKKAFRKLAHQYHPDKGTGDEAKFKEINEAYSVISDPEKRREYDQFGKRANGAGPQGGGFGGFDFRNSGGAQDFDFQGSGFEDLFSGIFGGARRSGMRDRTGSDIQVDIEITFEEMVKGVQREVRLRKLGSCKTCHGTGGAPGSKEEPCKTCNGKGEVRRTMQTILGAFAQVLSCETCDGRGKTYAEKCPSCHGAGRVHEETSVSISIPAGVQEGQVLSVSGQGAAGEKGGGSGDLFVVIHVKPHPKFERRGDDIFLSLDISYSQAVLGDKIDVETIEGPVTMKIPAGTQAGEVFRIRGKGVPHLGRYGRGDHLVRVGLRVPKKLSGKAKKLIEELGTLSE